MITHPLVHCSPISGSRSLTSLTSLVISELSDEVVGDLVSQMERGNKKPKLRLAGWKKQSKKGTKFIYSWLQV